MSIDIDVECIEFVIFGDCKCELICIELDLVGVIYIVIKFKDVSFFFLFLVFVDISN